jgi:hypothetical protein
MSKPPDHCHLSVSQHTAALADALMDDTLLGLEDIAHGRCREAVAAIQAIQERRSSEEQTRGLEKIDI